MKKHPSNAVGTDADPSRAPLMEHLIELRRRLLLIVTAIGLVFFVLFFVGQDAMFGFITFPLRLALVDQPDLFDVIATGLLETFFALMKVALYGALLVTMPLILFQSWRFVAPGLFQNERSAVAPMMAASPFLFLFGGLLSYFFVTPYLVKYLLIFSQSFSVGDNPISNQLRIAEYAGFFMRMVLAFGIAFQLPVGISLATRAGLTNPRQLSRGRRYAVLLIMLACAFLTPPEPVSMLVLFIPVYALYELSIWIARLIYRRQADDNPYLDPEYQDPEEAEDLADAAAEEREVASDPKADSSNDSSASPGPDSDAKSGTKSDAKPAP